MPSPFPGMDPFLEDPAYWSDFHATFINYWREALGDALPPNYEAGLGERVYLIEHDPEERKLVFPDVGIMQTQGIGSRSQTASGVATLEPVTIPLTILEGPRETYIEILHRPDRSLVAVLELLSRAKEPIGRTTYLSHRKSLLYEPIHLMELDLLCGGHRLPLARPLPPGDCYYWYRVPSSGLTASCMPGACGNVCRRCLCACVRPTRIS